MNTRKYFIILIKLQFLINILLGQEESIKFTNISINNGLSQSTVNCILQDRMGFMWFGTLGGLNQYQSKQ
jgi:ligand-binding sensor domain-containing protein